MIVFPWKGVVISLKKYNKYSRSGNKRETREIVKEEVNKEVRNRKPRNGSRKRKEVAPIISVNKTEALVADLNRFRVKSNIAVKFGVGKYLCWDCSLPDKYKISGSDEATLFRSNEMAHNFCKENNINNYTLDEL
ncbi:MAG: hypothetical protein HRU18_01120 [Pseudoalteromonas sp.]|uniref:hypothetical protein n=1 Tax=Pseudoalteromonas sp. TaxID=53249 RepID=UPI001DCB8EDC|nr:hypothetical protein [Pseudoalteromonas sp.]NRA76780.1 hypothetical protein [Pseudoalteromonas sp.]